MYEMKKELMQTCLISGNYNESLHTNKEGIELKFSKNI